MPTGYTASIEDGSITTGKEFLIRCARAFGACVEMRDEPLSVPIPFEFTPSTYYKTQIVESEKNLKKFLTLTLDDAQDMIDKEYQTKQIQCAAAIKRQEKVRQNYRSVREDVERWELPAPEYDNLKEFALNQIAISCDSDSMIAYWEAEMLTPKVSPEEWLQARIESAQESLEQSKKRWRDEVENTDKKNKWLRVLRESLNQT